jgi:hypothetical protein
LLVWNKAKKKKKEINLTPWEMTREGLMLGSRFLFTFPPTLPSFCPFLFLPKAAAEQD